MSDLSEDLQKMVSMMKIEMASLKKSCRLIEFYESESFTTRIDQLRKHICLNLLPKFSTQAIDLLKSLLDLRPEVSEGVNNNNRAVCDVFMRVCATLGQTYEACNTPLDEIIEQVFNLFITSDFNVCDIIFQFKNVLGNEALKSIEQKLKHSYNSQNGPYVVTALTLRSKLKQIADCQDDVIAYISACSFNSQPSTEEHLEIADRFIKHCKGQEAIEWLDSMEISRSNLWDNKMKKLKVKALELCGNFDEAQAERLQWFKNTLSTKVYKAIVKHSKPDFIGSFQKVAIKTALDFPDIHIAISFFVEIKEYEYLAQLVILKSFIIDGKRYNILRSAADILLQLDPLAATLLHRQLIQSNLANAISRYYSLAAKDLITCGILSTKITDWRQCQNHESYFFELASKHHLKTSFWAEYHIALYEQKEKWSKNTKI